MKKVSFYWAWLVGLLTVAVQVFTFYARFGHWNMISGVLDYVLFFGAGALGGWILIYCINRQDSLKGRWVVLIVFLLASPVALIMMLGGGLIGWIGVLLFPLIPWALFTWLGSCVGNLVSRV